MKFWGNTVISITNDESRIRAEFEIDTIKDKKSGMSTDDESQQKSNLENYKQSSRIKIRERRTRMPWNYNL